MPTATVTDSICRSERKELVMEIQGWVVRPGRQSLNTRARPSLHYERLRTRFTGTTSRGKRVLRDKETLSATAIHT